MMAIFEIFQRFFILGLMSFGGPAAHIGYFRHTFVNQHKWMTEAEYGNLVALSQILPGPGSSQVCFAIGYQRSGLVGALTAFLAFTFPSFLLMLGFAIFHSVMTDNTIITNVIAGLKIIAVIVVIDAVVGMYRSFCQQKLTQLIAVATFSSILLLPLTSVQFIAVVLAAIVGGICLSEQPKKLPVSQNDQSRVGYLWLGVFLLLFTLSFLPIAQYNLAMFAQYYQAGSLVFGGGHVVLPLLQAATSEVITNDNFLAGYAAAQAIPGPMFTFATFLGYIEHTNAAVLGAVIATLAIFLPGFLLMLAFLSNWQSLMVKPKFSGAMLGVNAAVVGLLMAALYQPIFTSAVTQVEHMVLVVVGVLLLKAYQWSVLRLLVLMLVGAISYSLLM